MATRKVQYYKVSIEERNTHNDVIGNMYVILNDIIRENCLDVNGTRSMILQQGEVGVGNNVDRVTMDIFNFDNTYLFARVGKTKDIAEALIRDLRTNEVNNVVDPQEIGYKKLEIFTYFLLDITNGVLAFIEGQSMPSVNVLRNIVNNYNELYEMRVDNIASNETIRALLLPGSVISRINYSFRVPNPEVLAGLNLPLEAIDVLNDSDLTEVRMCLKNDNRRYLASEPRIIERLINAFGAVAERNTDDVYITGRTANSSVQDYSYGLENFSTSIDIPTTRVIDGNVVALRLEEIATEAFNRMRATYFTNREHIINIANIA